MTSTKSLKFSELTRQATEILKRFIEPSSAVPELTRLLCQWFDCEWGTYWNVDQSHVRLTAIYTWNKASIAAEKLRKDTESRSLAKNEGTAGQVWRSGLPICTNDVVLGLCLPRSLDATAVGLKRGIWFPIRTKTRTFAVIELLAQRRWSFNDRFVDELTMLGLELGAVCARARDAHAE